MNRLFVVVMLTATVVGCNKTVPSSPPAPIPPAVQTSPANPQVTPPASAKPTVPATVPKKPLRVAATTEDEAFAAVEKLDGVVKRDEKTPGKPVVMVSYYPHDMTDDDLRDIAPCKELTYLQLSRGVTEEGLKGIRAFTKLKTLKAHYTPVTDAVLKEWSGLKNLEILDLTDSKVTDEGLKVVAGFKDLKELELSGTPVTDAGLLHLAELKKLEVLKLFHAENVKDAGLKSLAGLTNLHELELNFTAINGSGLKDLATLTGLQKLDLSGTPLTDEGLKNVAAFKDLQELSIYQTQVTDVGLKELTGLKKLRRLVLQGNKVSDGGIAELKKALPNCDISK